MNIKKSLLMVTSGALLLAATSCSTKEKEVSISYPVAEKGDVVHTYFGQEVADPYAWMENDTTQKVKAWVDAEVKVTEEYFSKLPFREQLRERYTAMANFEKVSAPSKKHGKYYFFKNDGLQNQSVMYVKDSLNGEAKVFLDPNTLSEDGTVALTSTSFSNDGKYMAYTISRKGSDWTEIFVMEVATGKVLEDHITWAKFTTAEWRGNGFYYSAYEAPSEGKEFSNVNENHRIYYHTVGSPQSEDKIAYENLEFPKRFYRATISEDENFMFIYEDGNNTGNRMLVHDLRTAQAPIEIAAQDQYIYNFLESFGNELYFITNNGAPKYRLMKTTIDKPEFENWVDVIAESENVMQDVTFIGEKMVVTYMEDAASHAYVYNKEGEQIHKVALPSLGSVSFTGSKKDDEAFFSFWSFIQPTTVYKYDINANIAEPYLVPEMDFNVEEYETNQVFYTSKDGTKVPMFIIHKKGMEMNGQNPLLLYGYGGFNASLTPRFKVSNLAFLENGGIYVSANIRGGGEYGEEWHLAGTKMNKQNVFDDFIAAAEYLIENQYTCKEKLAIMGGSNGGLLIGAVVNQRPDLCQVAISQVGVMDMLRYHKFTIGWNWASDYGTSEDSEEMFQYLYAYSPIHNIKNDGTAYPAIMITTADHDDRVVPAHSFKYAATLQAANTGDAPKIIRIDRDAGHAAGKPLSKQIEEWADTYAFIFHNLGMNMK